jgi:tRNA nucleotidyltransferase (CCA-adding enzyme)
VVNGQKIFERLHMPLNQKMKFVQNGNDEFHAPLFYHKKTVTDSAVRRVFDAEKTWKT